jgi:hypothetical protein
MRSRLLPVTVWVLAFATPVARSVVAQERFEIGPFAALYLPTGSFQPAPYYSTALPTDPSDMSGLALGGQAKLWLSPRVGFQLQAAIVSSTVGGGPTPIGVLSPTQAQVLTLTAQGLYDLRPTPSTRLWLSAGAGLIRHCGAAYSPYGSPTQLAGVLGLGSSLPIYHGLRANLGVTTLWYVFTARDSTSTTVEHGFQLDALLQAGLSWAWH